MMKKLLIIALILMGINSAIFAQSSSKKDVTTKREKVDTTASSAATAATAAIEVISLESVSNKIDQFVDSQNKTNSKLEKKIDRANQRMQDIQNQSSLRWLLRDAIPIVVLIIIGVFIIAIVYIIANNSYRNNMLKYETMMKCIEKIGSVPDIFNKIEKRESLVVAVGGRVHLTISLLCGIMSVIFLLTTLNIHGFFQHAISIFGMVIFAIAAFLLFKQYNNICENSRKE